MGDIFSAFPHPCQNWHATKSVNYAPQAGHQITKHEDQMAPVGTLWQYEPAVDAFQVWLKYITDNQIKTRTNKIQPSHYTCVKTKPLQRYS